MHIVFHFAEDLTEKLFRVQQKIIFFTIHTWFKMDYNTPFKRPNCPHHQYFIIWIPNLMKSSTYMMLCAVNSPTQPPPTSPFAQQIFFILLTQYFTHSTATHATFQFQILILSKMYHILTGIALTVDSFR